MKLYDTDNCCFISFDETTITDNLVNKISNALKHKCKPTIIDLQGVNNCVNKFYFLFKEFNDIVLVNIDSLILSTLFITGFDKYVKIYGEPVSLEDKKHELINRRFKIF